MIYTMRLFIAAWITQICSLLALVRLSNSKTWGILIFLGALCAMLVLVKLARDFEVSRALIFIVSLAATGVCTLQLFGFFAYPGLVKDVTPFSGDHALLMLKIFILSLASYLTGYAFIKAAYWIKTRRR